MSIGTTTGDLAAINAPTILTKFDFEACCFRKVEIIFLSGCSMVVPVFNAN